MSRRFFIATFFAVAASFLGSLHAGEIPWIDSSYYYFAQSQQLTDLIRDFTAIQGIDVVIDPELSGTVNGIFEGIPPEDFWDSLSKAYNLCWFYDGSILYVYPGSSISTQVIPMGPQEGNSLKAIVGEMDFASSSCSLRYMLATKMMVLSGPPRFLEVVQGLLDSIQINTIQNFVDETVVQIFPLKYAFAYDVSLSVGTGGGVTIEGIATILQRILSGINSVPQTSQEAVSLSGTASGQPVEGMIQRREQQVSQEQGSRPASEGGKGREPAEKKTAAAPKKSGQPTKSPESGTAAAGTGNPPRQSQITSITYDARL
ncbi:MAG: hypothetical protein LBH53_00735, partial [Puniceicoccales bacterium]|nr:hypothetical protein [Puniceicoccales bacterium]